MVIKETGVTISDIYTESEKHSLRRRKWIFFHMKLVRSQNRYVVMCVKLLLLEIGVAKSVVEWFIKQTIYEWV